MKLKNGFLIIIFFIACNLSAQDISWYKCLKGVINKYPITMHLHKMAHNFSGYYYYNSKQEPVYFIGEDTTMAGKIKLLAFSQSTDPGNEEFLFTITTENCSGEWKKNDSSKAYVFSATESTDTSLLSFKMIYTYDEMKLKPLQESPTATFEAASVWPENNTTTSSFIKKFINEEFGNKYSEKEVETILINNKQQFFDEYKAAFKDAKEEDIKEMPSTFSEERSNRLMIVYQSKNILTLANFSYSYTGGAHGNYGTSYTSLDLVNKKKIKLNDVITKTGQTHLPSLLKKYFQKNYNLSANTSLKEAGLFEEKLKPNDNFYVTEKGIGFSYVPYEIGPYAMGEINIFIPFTELNNFLEPEFKR